MTTTAELLPERRPASWRRRKARRRAADAAEADLLQLAVEWAVMHPPESIDEAATHTLRGFGDTDLRWLVRVLRASPSSAWPSSRRWSVCPPRPASATSARPSSCASACRGCGGASPPVTCPPGRAASWPASDPPHARGRDVRRPPRRARRPPGARLPARPAGRRPTGRSMPDQVERLAAQAAERRHVTVHDQLVSSSGTTYVEAELDLADALDFEAAVAAGAEQRAALGSARAARRTSRPGRRRPVATPAGARPRHPDRHARSEGAPGRAPRPPVRGGAPWRRIAPAGSSRAAAW